jgi:hypothetical protein
MLLEGPNCFDIDGDIEDDAEGLSGSWLSYGCSRGAGGSLFQGSLYNNRCGIG